MGKQNSDRKHRFCQEVIPKHAGTSNQNTSKIAQLFWWPFGGPSKSSAELYKRRVVNFFLNEHWSISYPLCHSSMNVCGFARGAYILKVEAQFYSLQLSKWKGKSWYQSTWMHTWSQALRIFLQLYPIALTQNFTQIPRTCFLHHISSAAVCTSYTRLGSSSNFTKSHLLTLWAGTASFNNFCPVSN